MEELTSQLSELQKYIAPATVVVVSIIIGMFLQFLTNRKLAKAVEKTRWRGDDIIVQSLKGKIFFWTILIGLYSALPMLDLPASYNNFAQKVLLVLTIFSITLAVASVAGGFLKHYAGTTKTDFFSTSLVLIITRTVVITIGFLIILQSLNISITPMLTALGVGGLAVALALQDTLSNLFAGIHILATRRVRVGDWIELESGEVGKVIDITWRNTTVRQRRNNIIIIPNSRVAQSIMINYNLPEQQTHIRIEVGVSYDSDLEHVEKVTVEVAQKTVEEVPGGDPSHKPFIRYTAFSDFSINFYVNIRLREYNDLFRVRHEFIKRLHRRYNEEGIVIPFPIRTLDIPGNFRMPENPTQTS